jgi:hypothetical protein
VPMVTEIDILRAAKFLIARFGLYARVAAAERADKAYNKNDLIEESLWLRVMRAISSMEAPRPKSGRRLH